MENNELIKTAVKYINDLGGQKTTIEAVAKNAGFSIDYFNRIFRNHTGFNVMEYDRFRRLNKAARMLRMTSTDILSIALECGYESHEGFSRSFKEQYGKTPSEYREKMKEKPFVWADYEFNATAVSEFQHVLPDFIEKDPGEVIDWLLEKDARRYGYTAVTIAVNGSKIVTDVDLYENGCFVTIDNFYDKPRLTLVVNNVQELCRYVKMLGRFVPGAIDCIFHTDVTKAQVEKALEGIRYKEFREHAETMYFGNPFTLPKGSEKYDIHLLEKADLEAVECFIAAHSDEIFKRTGGFGLLQNLKKPLEQRPDSQPIGIFEKGKLWAIAYTAPQDTHGYRLNNCVHTIKLPDAPNEALKTVYLYATNAVMEQGYVVFEDAQFDEFAKEHGDFDAFDLGFERVNTVYSISF